MQLRSKKTKSSGEPSGDASKKRVKVSGDPQPISVTKVETPMEAVATFKTSAKTDTDYRRMYAAFRPMTFSRKDLHAMLDVLPTDCNKFTRFAVTFVLQIARAGPEFDVYHTFFVHHFRDFISDVVTRGKEIDAERLQYGLSIWTILMFGKNWRSACPQPTYELKPVTDGSKPDPRVVKLFTHRRIAEARRVLLGDVFLNYLLMN